MSAKPRAPVARSVKTPAALTVLREWLGSLDERVRQQGTEYATQGKVAAVWAAADHYVSAEVQGEERLYEVTLFYTRGGWSSQCGCDRRVRCKHACAAGLAWLSAVESGAADRDELTPDPPPAGPMTAAVPLLVSIPATAPAPRKMAFREQWEPKLVKKLGRALTTDEGLQLEALSALFTEFYTQRHRMLFPDTLRRHGFGFLVPAGVYNGPLFSGWWDHDTAPADPWALWQFLAYEIERTGGMIPELFRPMTDTSGIEARLQESLLKKEIDDWRDEMLRGGGEGAEGGEREMLPRVAGLRGRFSAEGWLYIETRADDDKPWRSPPPTWFRALAGAYPSDFAHLPPAEAALGVVLALACRQPAAQAFFGRRPAPLEVVTPVLADPVARGAVLLPGGKPFAVEPEALLRAAQVAPGEPDRLEFHLVTAEGRDASAARLLAKQPEALYLFENRVWRGPAPVPRKRLPIAALSDTRIMSRLRAGGLRLPKEIESRMKRVELRPRLRLWVEEAPLPHEGERIYAALTAHAAETPAAQEWRGAQGWQWARGEGVPATSAGGAPVEFDLSAAEGVTALLPAFRLEWSDQAHAWTRAVTKSFPEEFEAWHATLPPGLEVELADELGDIIAPALQAHVDFSATPAGSGHDWFDLTVALRVEDTKLTQEEIALLLKARGKWVRLEKRGWRRLELAASDEQTATLDRLGLGVDDVLAVGKPVKHRLHALQLASEVGSFAARDAKFVADLRERVARLAAIPKPPLPAGLRATLRPYQEEGFHFLAHLSALGFGGVLADDMGLGKTVQTLAWLLHLAAQPRPAGEAFRALVVCPKSVTHGWLAETERFAPSLRAIAFEPGMKWKKLAALDAELIVANYTQMRLQADWFQSGAWDVVVLDEGQFIKNPTSQAAFVARELPAKHRVVLTGTPVENRLTDLWSLFAFAQPGLLGAQAAFRRQYSEEMPESLARLRRRVGHFLLRRTKAQAAPDLPPRTEDDLVVELEGPQRKLYEAELKRARAHLLGVETSRALDKVRFNVLASLLRLRQICCHPALIDPAHREMPSAKLDALLERLEELRDEGHQVLVFSQFVEMLEIIRTRLEAEGIAHLMLTGATENRAELVEQFQTDRSKTVFLLSLKAAGFGLNLTAASYAVLYDPWWNPAVEAQAIDRTHRIGQTRPVMAYRLLAADTVEQKIRALQREKNALAASVVQEESLASVMDLDSLRRILE